MITVSLILAAGAALQAQEPPKEWGKREWGSDTEMLRKGENPSMHYAAEQATCPVCSAKIRVAGMGVSYSSRGKDLDFKTSEYVSANPYLFALWMCPECNYCAKAGDFEKKVDPAKIRAALGTTTRYDSYFDITYSALLRRAEQCYGVREFSDEDWGWLYLYGAWVARDSKQEEAEKEYHKKSQARFAIVSEKGQGNARAAAAYLVGEIYRRQGEKAKAVEWLAKAEKISEEVKSKNIPSWIQSCREEMAKPKTDDKGK